MPALSPGFFSQRDAFTNVNEALATIDNARRVWEPFQNAKRDKAKRLNDIQQFELGAQEAEGIKNALSNLPDYFNNRIGAEDSQNQFMGERSKTALANLPMENQLKNKQMGSAFKDLDQKEANRPMAQMEDRLSALDRITKLVDPEIVKNPEAFPDSAVDDYYTATGIEIPGWLQLDPTQRRQAISEGILSRRQASEAELIRRFKLQQQMTPAQLRGQPFAALANGQPGMFQSTDRGIVTIPGLSPQTSASNTRTKTRTLPDGSQTEVIFDTEGKELATVPLGTAKKEGSDSAQRISEKLVDSYAKGFQDRQQKTAEAESSLALIEANLKDQSTGAIGGLYQSGAAYLGDPTKDAVAGIANNMAINLRAAGTGALSNRDMDLLLAQVPSIWNPPQANQELIKRFKIAAEAIKTRDLVVPSLLEAGYSFPQADALYRKYAEQVPLSKQTQQGIEIVSERPSFEEWFSSQQSNVPRGTNQSGGVLMQAPDGSQAMVPQDKVEEAQQMGAQLVQ